MADIGLGYGSEYQLLRALGHHREAFFRVLRNALSVNGEIRWRDYPTDTSSLSLDGEYCDIQCFKGEPVYDKLFALWPDFWPVRGRYAQNWDGVFTIGDDWYFVEAKAHLSELKSKHKKSIKSDPLICQSFQRTIDWLQSTKTGEDWLLSPYYQFANRLAFCCFLRENGIKAHIVNIFFLNGYDKPQLSRNAESIIDSTLSVDSASKWQAVIDKEISVLGLDKDRLEGIAYEVFVDCLYPAEDK